MQTGQGLSHQLDISTLMGMGFAAAEQTEFNTDLAFSECMG
jgi:hypothetical protein